MAEGAVEGVEVCVVEGVTVAWQRGHFYVHMCGVVAGLRLCCVVLCCVRTGSSQEVAMLAGGCGSWQEVVMCFELGWR